MVTVRSVETDHPAGGADGPPLPHGRRVDLDHRGTTFVREIAGPPGAPTVVLLHGWMASGGLNWFRAFEALGDEFRVLAPDLRGHARGLRSLRRFTLADCADDVAAMLVALDAGPAILVGYSMGGPVAQLVFRRHMDLVEGMVLCATSTGFVPGGRERLVFTTMMAAAAGSTRLGGLVGRLPWLGMRNLAPAPPARPSSMQAWAAREFRRHDWRHVLEAGHALGTFHSGRWIHQIDVPTAVMLTTRDRAVPPALQLNMAESIPDSEVLPVDGGHVVCAAPSFGPQVLAGCRNVAERVERWQG